MKNQDSEERLKASIEENKRLRNEIHNLKRQVKRLKIKNIANGEIARNADNENDDDKINKITTEGIEEIKKKLRADGVTERGMEVLDWFLSEVTGSPKK